MDEVLRRHPKANGLFDGVISQSARRRRIAAGWAEPWENILGQPNFSASQSKKHWNQSQSAKFPFRLGNAGIALMTGSLLDECCESILKIAETQPPVGKMAISMMAEMFRENSGQAARDGQLSSSQDFQAPDRQPIPFRGRTTTRHALKG
ncbi:hypothetical protein [Bradyrhizobium canariense]|uniref:hypothetical protein n=1 Tax=Bradyrhizobium canariense TaxID=255045 RepID=UPI0011BABC91|nr:hypothetical protein [Bradyrhizobium canariense]